MNSNEYQRYRLEKFNENLRTERKRKRWNDLFPMPKTWLPLEGYDLRGELNGF